MLNNFLLHFWAGIRCPLKDCVSKVNQSEAIWPQIILSWLFYWPRCPAGCECVHIWAPAGRLFLLPPPPRPLMPGTLVRRVDKKCASFLYGHNGGVNMAEMFKLFINQTGFFIALSRFPCPLCSYPFPAICRAFYIEVNKPKSKFCLCCASQECINIILKSQWNMANDFDEWPHLPPPVPPSHTHTRMSNSYK